MMVEPREAARRRFTLRTRRHRWFQCSLRTLLVLVALCAILCSWLGFRIREARRMREAASAIEKAGGKVAWGESGRWAEPGCSWKSHGDGFSTTVLWVSFEDVPVADADLKPLEALSQLEELWLNNTNVTDAGLKHVERLRHLRWLRLENTRVTDVGLAHLKGLTPRSS